ncbi:hypothetical protein PS718_05095 [Pseudomonas fluorescens]|uniref:Uncharacterized protein n=1 Tax=Pseudomonas fluorescens TaxID=294 RepID=A0A5E7F005_PSEFL|nr:hypothetical protein PS718_05095 [Pseudomonas fluorescens]
MLICWRLFASDYCARQTPAPVGAGLPAIASGQALSMSRLPASSLASLPPQGMGRNWPTVRPPSRAGSLLQVLSTFSKNGFLSGETPRRSALGLVVCSPLTPALSRGRGSRFLGLSTLEFDSVSHVGVPLANTSVSPLSLWERVRVRVGFWLFKDVQTGHAALDLVLRPRHALVLGTPTTLTIPLVMVSNGQRRQPGLTPNSPKLISGFQLIRLIKRSHVHLNFISRTRKHRRPTARAKTSPVVVTRFAGNRHRAFRKNRRRVKQRSMAFAAVETVTKPHAIGLA